MPSPFRLQLVYADGSQIRWHAGTPFERDLIESCTQAIVRRGVGVFRTEAQVKRAIAEGMAEALLGLKREARKVVGA